MQRSDIHDAISKIAEDFASAFGRGDAAGIAEFYTDNGMLLPSGFDFVQGKGEIEAFWQRAMEMGIKNAKVDTLEVEQHGDTVIEVGRYRLSDADDRVMDQGKGMVIWKYRDGRWKIHRDIWTSSEAQS